MARNTIKVKDYLHVNEEYVAGGAITPGMLVALNNAGAVVAHPGANQDAFPMFAQEDELQGKTIDDAYASGNRVQVWVPTRGDIVNGLLANTENVAIGDFLCSNGDGTLQKYVAASVGDYPIAIVGQAIEALNNTSGAAARILFRVY